VDSSACDIGEPKESFYEELKQVFLNYFPKYHIKILLRDFNAKVGGKNTNRQFGVGVYISILMIMVLE
jgi:hypothetical protein